jgi:preprotein translocase subunit YajC
VSRATGAAATDIKEGDRIVDAGGLQYRVEFVADEGGQSDHFKVYLCVLKPEGD